jgi:hypothetical protein
LNGYDSGQSVNTQIMTIEIIIFLKNGCDSDDSVNRIGELDYIVIIFHIIFQFLFF